MERIEKNEEEHGLLNVPPRNRSRNRMVNRVHGNYYPFKILADLQTYVLRSSSAGLAPVAFE